MMKSHYYPFIFLLAIGCSSPQSNSTEEAAEEVPEMEAAEEAVEMAEAEPTRQPYELDKLPCKENGEILLDNFYQLTDQDMARLEQENRYNNNILWLINDFSWRVNWCLGKDSHNSYEIIQKSDEFFQATTGEYRQETRDDLMPVEKQMRVVPEHLVNYAINNLIPDPTGRQYNNYVYSSLYEFYRMEFRKLYFAYQLLNQFSSWEMELRGYALAANRITTTSEETRTINNYDTFFSYISKFEYPEWAYIGDVNIDLANYYKDYCSFWLRRGLDGSHDELIELQEKILLQFDKVWYEKLKKALEKLPPITFDEDRVAQVNPSLAFISLKDIDIPDSLAKTADNGFMIEFDNGKSKIYSEGEYNSYSLRGYLPELNLFLINKYSEYPVSFLLNKADGSAITFEGTVSSFKPSPDGTLFIAGISSEIGDYSGIYQFTKEGYDKVMVSKFINAPNMDWVANDEIRMKTGYGGDVFIDLSGFVKNETARQSDR